VKGYVLAAAAAMALVLVLGAICAVSSAPAPAGALRIGTRRVAPSYYVAVGASESVGYQPVPGERHGAPTGRGYANDLVRMEQRRWPGMALIELGCPGITAVTALDGVTPGAGPGGPSQDSAGRKARCTYPAGSEVSTAAQLIRQRAGKTVLVTVDLGFNDVWPCLRHDTVDNGCVTAALDQIARALPAVLSRLRDAGGPRMLIVGLEHSDPYEAEWLRGKAAFAEASQHVIDRLNGELTALYTSGGALVADVPAVYGTAAVATRPGDGGTVPHAAARMCALTWMCGSEHNLHPTDAGYQAIADAVAASIASAPVLPSVHST
jgi:lysophospholipase L1-like esterase